MGKKKTVFEKALVIWGKNLEKEATRAKSIVRSGYEVVFADGSATDARPGVVVRRGD